MARTTIDEEKAGKGRDGRMIKRTRVTTTTVERGGDVVKVKEKEMRKLRKNMETLGSSPDWKLD